MITQDGNSKHRNDYLSQFNAFCKAQHLKHRNDYLNRIEALCKNAECLDMAFVLLSCFVDELAGLKYSSENGGKARFKKILQNYYDNNEFELIDLLYFAQWEDNEYLEKYSKRYWQILTKDKNLYNEVRKDLGNLLAKGKLDSNRYKSLDEIIEYLRRINPDLFKQYDTVKNEEYLKKIQSVKQIV